MEQRLASSPSALQSEINRRTTLPRPAKRVAQFTFRLLKAIFLYRAEKTCSQPTRGLPGRAISARTQVPGKRASASQSAMSTTDVTKAQQDKQYNGLGSEREPRLARDGYRSPRRVTRHSSRLHFGVECAESLLDDTRGPRKSLALLSDNGRLRMRLEERRRRSSKRRRRRRSGIVFSACGKRSRSVFVNAEWRLGSECVARETKNAPKTAARARAG